jgi:glycosyltransferase involved in cell wall biosynthesis
MATSGGPRRWFNRATFALCGLFFFIAFACVRALTLAARFGRRRVRRGPVRNVLFLPHDPIDQAGTRHRMLAWVPRLRAHGVHVAVAPPNSPTELSRLYGSRPQLMELLAIITFVRRLLQILSASRHDLVVFARAALPRFPFGGAVMERLLVAVQPRAVMDIDDAVWAYTPPPLGLPLVPVHPDRTDRAMEAVHGVIAGNRFLAERASRVNGRVHVIPTCVDPERVPRRRHERQRSPVLGWIGTPGNLRHLVSIVPALRRIGTNRAIRLRVVSTVPFDLPGVRVENVFWSAERETRDVASFDVGLMPLERGPAFEGKCGLKLLQYAAAGVPAVASPVGVNSEIIRPGETGYLATTEDEWVESLLALLDDDDARIRMGAAAREDARARWSHDAHFMTLCAALEIETDA